MTVDKVVAALSSLTQAELRIVRLALDKLETKGEKQPLDTELYKAAVELLGQKDIGVKAFSRTQAYSIWIKNQKSFDSLIDNIIGDIPRSKVKTLHLKKFLMSLLLAHLKSRKVELTMPLIALHMIHIEGVFRRAFPGYIESGLTHLVLKGLGG
jgi:hypothetical protein